jgi:hypothetical protein
VRVGGMNQRIVELEEKERQEIPESKIRLMQGLIDSLSASFERRMDRIYPEEDFLKLGDTLEKVCKSYDLKLTSIIPDFKGLSQLIEGKTDISELPITIELTGRFLDLGSFIDDLDHLPFIIKLNEVNLEKQVENQYNLKITLQGVIFLRKEREHDGIQNRKTITNRA